MHLNPEHKKTCVLRYTSKSGCHFRDGRTRTMIYLFYQAIWGGYLGPRASSPTKLQPSYRAMWGFSKFHCQILDLNCPLMVEDHPGRRLQPALGHPSTYCSICTNNFRNRTWNNITFCPILVSLTILVYCIYIYIYIYMSYTYTNQLTQPLFASACTFTNWDAVCPFVVSCPKHRVHNGLWSLHAG